MDVTEDKRFSVVWIQEYKSQQQRDLAANWLRFLKNSFVYLLWSKVSHFVFIVAVLSWKTILSEA